MLIKPFRKHVHEQVVELALEIFGEQALELREQHAAAAERVSGNDVEHLIEQRAALELVDAGLHPCGGVASVKKQHLKSTSGK